MSKLLTLISKLAKKRAFFLLLAAYAFVFGTILFTIVQITQASGGSGILDFERGYTHTKVMEVLSSYGERGMQLYARIQWLDLLNPALYSLVLAVVAHKILQGRGPIWLPVLALLGGVGDYLENITLFLITRSFPDVSESLVEVSTGLSWLKNGLMAVSGLSLIVAVIIWLWRRFR